MNTANNTEPRIKAIEITEELIIADLVDGRTISVPLVWSWRLAGATPAQRKNYKFIGDGQGVHWPDIDEDISAEGMLMGVPARPLKSVCKVEILRHYSQATVMSRLFCVRIYSSPTSIKN